MVANQVHSKTQLNKGDGCLLLSLEENVLFSLNESAQVIWSIIEKHPPQIAIEQLIDCMEAYYSSSVVSRFRLRCDAEKLLTELCNRGFLVVSIGPNPEHIYSIKGDVFRTASIDVSYSEIDEEFEAGLAYRPHESIESTCLRSLTDTLVGVVALILFEIVRRVSGFGRLCEIVEHWPVKKDCFWSSQRVRQVCAGIDRARMWYPKQVLCLQHSAVVTCLLRRQGVPARMVFGARRKPFYAHAWSEVYGTVVNDDQAVRDRYPRFIRCLESSSWRANR